MTLLIFNIIMVILVIAMLAAIFRDAFSKKSKPPFIRTRRAVAAEVIEVFGDIPSGSVVYDLGAGDGRMLRTIAAHNPGSTYVSIEVRWIPFLMGVIKTRFMRQPVQHVRDNLFDHDLSQATHIYTYLYPWVMDELLPKLEREASPGLKLVSLDFPFLNKEETAKISLRSASPRRLGRTIYVYEF